MAADQSLEATFGRYIWCELCGYVYRTAAWEASGMICPNCGGSLDFVHVWSEIQ